MYKKIVLGLLCLAIAVLVNGSVPAGESIPSPVDEAKLPVHTSKAFALTRIELTEIRVHSWELGTGAVINDLKIEPKGFYTLLRDTFIVRFSFTEPIDSERFASCVEVEPEIAFSVDPSPTGESEVCFIQIRFDEPMAVGTQFTIRLKGLHSAAGGKLPDDTVDLHFVKAEEPRVTLLECLTYPYKPAQEFIDFDLMTYLLPPGELDFRVLFSKPMQRDSVERVLRQSAAVVSTTWKDDRELRLKITPGQSSVVDLSDSLDRDGYSVVTPPIFAFIASPPTRFYAYNVLNSLEAPLDGPHAVFHDASLSPDGETIVFREPSFHFELFYASDMLYRVKSQTVLKLEKDERHIPLNISPVVWSPDSRYFVAGSRLFNSEGTLLHIFDRIVYGAAFAPGGDRVAVLVAGDDLDSPAMLDCLIYDLMQMKLSGQFSGVTRAKMGEGYYYRVIESCWRGDSLLFEDSAYTDYARRPALASLDLNSGVKKELAAHLGELSFSPDGKWVLGNFYSGGAADDENGALFLYEIESGVKTALAGSPAFGSRWSGSGSRAWVDLGSGKYLLQMGQQKLTPLNIDGRSAGWLDEEKLLIFR